MPSVLMVMLSLSLLMIIVPPAGFRHDADILILRSRNSPVLVLPNTILVVLVLIVGIVISSSGCSSPAEPCVITMSSMYIVALLQVNLNSTLSELLSPTV